MSLLKSLKLREFGGEESRSGSVAAASSVLIAPRAQEPKMSSQFPAFQDDEEEEDEDDEHFKSLLEKVERASEQKLKQSKRKRSEEIVKNGLKSLTTSTTQSANEFKAHWGGKVEEIVYQLDRKAALAKEGQEKLITTKASVIEAIELKREKLKRVLHQLKEHEKEVIAMRDVHLKQTSVKELNRATASIEEKLGQMEQYLQKVMKKSGKEGKEDKLGKIVELISSGVLGF